MHHMTKHKHKQKTQTQAQAQAQNKHKNEHKHKRARSYLWRRCQPLAKHHRYQRVDARGNVLLFKIVVLLLCKRLAQNQNRINVRFVHGLQGKTK